MKKSYSLGGTLLVIALSTLSSQAATVCPSAAILNGLDVSVFNGTVDWNSVGGAKVSFAFAMVSDGTNADSSFDANYAGIQSAGMVRGAYQFFRPSQDPVAQANLCLSKIGTFGPGDLPPALDVEVTDGLSSTDVASAIQAWANTMQTALGRASIIYCSADFWDLNVGISFSSDPLWVADWEVVCPTLPSTWSAWKFWQTSANGSLPGISGPVDLDVFNGTQADLAAMTGPPGGNNPPVLVFPIPIIINISGSFLAYTFPVNTFIDPDLGQTLTYTANNLPLGITFDGSSRTFGGTSASEGTYTVTIIATDNGAPPLSASCTFQLTFQLTAGHTCTDGVKNGTETGIDCGGPTCPPCNKPPATNNPPVLANPIPNITNSYGSTFAYTIPANTFSDLDDGQALIYAAANLPPGLYFDGLSHTFGGVAFSQGTYTVTITATDNGQPPFSASCTFHLTVSPNNPPVLANPIPNTTNTYGSAFAYTIPANTFSDPYVGQILTYTASNLPPGITFDGPSHTFGGMALSAGTYTMTITATDNGAPPLSASCTFQLTVLEIATPTWSLNAQVRWTWQPVQFPQSADVWSTVAVTRIFDTTGDGVVDEHDDPSIIFISGNDTDVNTGLGTCCNCNNTVPTACHRGVLRILNGRTGAEQFSLDRAFPLSAGFAGISVAVGDVLRNGTVQIVAVSAEGYVVLIGSLTGQLSVLRISDRPIPGSATANFGWGGGLAIGDMDGDGFPEIAYGATVFSSGNGAITLRFTGGAGVGGGSSAQALSTMANLDGNGVELLAGNTAYRPDGTVLWHRADLPDGFNAVADLDQDGKPEVVLVAGGKVSILDAATGATKLGPVSLPGSGSGGPPVVADFDGDGRPEIGGAMATAYSVLKPDFINQQVNVLWQAATHDLSSSVTASTAFDFEGNGQASVVYSDECFLWVFDGATGAVRFAAPHTSFTGTETPVVADVDGDGRAEIVMISNGVDPGPNGWQCLGSVVNGVAWQPSVFPAQPYRGITVFGAGDTPWTRAPAIWNEATYHVSNVSDGTGNLYPGLAYGAIPTNEVPNWTVPWLNNFRQNRLPPPRTPPIATCKHVTVFAGANCTAAASIDDGSYDPDTGDTITLTQTPPGPYSLGQTMVTLIVTDNHGASNTCTALGTVSNPTPVVTLTGPVSSALIALNTPVNFTATFTDANGGTHTGTWMFDGISQAATIVEPIGATPGSATATHTFTAAGVYSVKLTVNDNCGSSGTTNQVEGLDVLVIVYDPSAGFVTGGGWIMSPAGAYAPDATLTGKANFGFVSKYQKGQVIPTGETEFQLHCASFNFQSTSYQWLVVSGARAQYKGSGQINGAGDYGFLLTATDGQFTGGGGADKFRIKIWSKATNTVIYDNVLGASDDIDLANPRAIGGGNIVIQK